MSGSTQLTLLFHGMNQIIDSNNSNFNVNRDVFERPNKIVVKKYGNMLDQTEMGEFDNIFYIEYPDQNVKILPDTTIVSRLIICVYVTRLYIVSFDNCEE